MRQGLHKTASAFVPVGLAVRRTFHAQRKLEMGLDNIDGLSPPLQLGQPRIERKFLLQSPFGQSTIWLSTRFVMDVITSTPTQLRSASVLPSHSEE
jgi:hypothetical protein